MFNVVFSMLKTIGMFLITIFLIKSSRISDARPLANGYGYDPTNLRFDCENRNYISSFLVCDGVDDCMDETDENNCRKLCSSDPSGDECINEICSLNSTSVGSRGGVKICSNQSDEKECTPTTYGVVGAFYCNVGECIFLNETCYSSSGHDCKENGGKFQCQKIIQINATHEPTIKTDESDANGPSGIVLAIIVITIIVIIGAILIWRRRWFLMYFACCQSRASIFEPLKKSLNININDPPDCSHKWVLTRGGKVVPYAVCAGEDHGSGVYVVRVVFQNKLIPGKFHNGRVLFPYKGKEVVIWDFLRNGSYEVLTDPDKSLEWVQCSSSDDIPKSAVIGGGCPKSTLDGSDTGIYYIGKLEIKSNPASTPNVACGKVNASDKRCYVSYGWKEHSSGTDAYKILVKSQKSVQNLENASPTGLSATSENSHTAVTRII